MYYHTGDEDSRLVALPEVAGHLRPERHRRPQHLLRQLDDVSSPKSVNRYGTNLDGFFFDDGMVLYYPASFEALHAAVREPATLTG